MSRATAVLGVLTLAAAAAAEARGEDPPKETPTATLALRARPGTTVRFVQTMVADQTANLRGMKTTTHAEITTQLGLEVAERAEDGAWRGTLRFGRIHGTMKMPMVGEVRADSGEPLPDDVARKSAAISITALAEREFPVVLEPDGRVRSVGGIEPAIEAALKRWGADASLRPVVAVAISEKKLRQTVDFALCTTPLPSAPAKAGTSWDDTDSVPGLSSGVEMEVRARHEVAEVLPDAVRIVGKGDLVLRAASGPGVNPRQARVYEHARVLSSSTPSEVRVSRDDGLPIASRRSMQVEIELGDPNGGKPLGTMAQETVFTMERVEAWPAAEPPAPEAKAPPAEAPKAPEAPK
jgi:hypothetical protein